MKTTDLYGVTKRGNSYNKRPNKLANGVSANFADQKKRGLKGVKDELLKLCVWGTFDSLQTHNNKGRVLKVLVRHPIDKEYRKTTYILKKNIHKFDIL